MEKLAVRPGREWTRRPNQDEQTGANYRDHLAKDRTQPAEDLRRHYADEETASYTITRHRYISQSFHDREVEGLWDHVWQMACREEQIPEAGDISVYEIAGRSYLVIRGDDMKIRAFRNTCTHRGMKLCTHDTSLTKLRCPFHGFSWNLEGKIIDIPMRWDFPGVKDEDVGLREARVGLWGGFVFINPDPDAPSLESFLEVLPEHMSGYADHEQKYIAAHFRKVLPCNWKLGIEAFVESYHTITTHPQFTGFLSDENGQYDILGRHVSRFCLTNGAHATAIADDLPGQVVVDEFFAANGLGNPPSLPQGMTPREYLVEYMRDKYASASGRDYSDCPETQVIDPIQYTLFPNIIMWRGLIFPAVYRFRPNASDPRSCIFDLYLLGDVPASGERPPAAETFDMGDMSFTEALKDISVLLAQTYEQDFDNLRMQQNGMAGAPDVPIVMAQAQEIRIRHLEKIIDQYLDRYAPLAARQPQASF